MKAHKIRSESPYTLEEVLRLVRDSVELNININEKDEEKIKNGIFFGNLEEGAKDEFNKVILSDYVDVIFHKLENLNVLKDFLPELSLCYNFNQKTKYHNRDVFNHIMSVTSLVPKSKVLRYAALFHDIAKPNCFTIDENGVGHFKNHDIASSIMARDILKKWNYEDEFIDDVTKLIKNHMKKHNDGSIACLKRLKKDIGRENVNNLLVLQIADNLSKNLKYVSIKGLVSLYKINNKKAVCEA
ncbi:MAG: HD domain-containing protein [Clostridium sp.]|uniref:HD domain-containing protein n=1 Tax=Clostridium sp. TaxID=1506 RepID=UPI002FC8DB39